MKKLLSLCMISLLATGLTLAQEVPFKRHYVNHTELGGLFGRVKYLPYAGATQVVENRLNLTLQTFNGMRINPRLSAGLTTGLDWYTTALITPIAAGARYDLAGKRNVRFFATADAGYGLVWFHEDNEGYRTQGGMMLNPGLGFRLGRPDGAAFTITLSYKRQEAFVTKPPLWDQTERFETREYNRMSLRMGITF
ncbi:hypothetical protein [Telluribacter humicola]|uniref:hypothetical protein n=1 Tax=Telluribacter humicola TaxID=1720261 RepID=UPI001A9591C2|nr:hypothetical protein [Telluribacter humicola]